MTLPDNWSGKTWKINEAIGDLGDTGQFAASFAPDDGTTTAFTLKLFWVDNTVRVYRADYAGTRTPPPPCWLQPFYLIQTGSRAAQPPTGTGVPALPLPAWESVEQGGDPTVEESYHTIVAQIDNTGNKTPSYERLEGCLFINGIAEAVVMYRFDAGVINPSEFIVIRVKADELKTTTRQSGVAHGNI